MKLVLSQKELQAIKPLAGILGSQSVSSNNVVKVSSTNDGAFEFDINEDCVVDYIGIITVAAPLMQALLSHVKSAFKTIMALGANFEAKWCVEEKVEEPKQESEVA